MIAASTNRPSNSRKAKREEKVRKPLVSMKLREEGFSTKRVVK
jgi:hypothetical protein